jgi:hypothetical protein
VKEINSKMAMQIWLVSLLLALEIYQSAIFSSAFSFLQPRLSVCSRLYLSNTFTSWNDLTVPELKSELKERRLPVSGNKAELIERLTEHEATSNNAKNPSDDLSQQNKKPKSSPPKDLKEIEDKQMEVRDAMRLLEGLKIGGASKEIFLSQLTDTKLSQQQKEMIQSLKESMQSAQNMGASTQNTHSQADLSPKQQARRELFEHHREQLRGRPANDLKEELTSLRLKTKGRKPDLVDRLAEYYVTQEMGADDEVQNIPLVSLAPRNPTLNKDALISFGGIPRLSTAAANALCQAFGDGSGKPPEPTPIQAVALSKLFYPPQPSAILHAPTGWIV